MYWRAKCSFNVEKSIKTITSLDFYCFRRCSLSNKMIFSANKRTAVYQIYLIFGCFDAWYLSRYIFCPNNYVLIFVSKSEAKNVYESILVFSMVFPTFVNVNQAFPLIDFPSLPDFPSYIKCVNATTSKYKWIPTITTRLGNYNNKGVKYQVWSREVITLHNKTTSGTGFLQMLPIGDSGL